MTFTVRQQNAMSTSIFDTCGECKENNELSNCKQCGFTSCIACFGKHDEIICKLIQKYPSAVSDVCKIHRGRKVVSFCFLCNVLLCDICQHEHQQHKNDIYKNNDLSVMDLWKHHLPNLILEYRDKELKADQDINSLLDKSKQIREIKTKLEVLKSPDDKQKILKQADEYEKSIDGRCDHLVNLKELLDHSIKGFYKIEVLSNPNVVFPILIGLRGEVSLVEEKIPTNDDYEFEYKELFDFYRRMCEKKEKHTSYRATDKNNRMEVQHRLGTHECSKQASTQKRDVTNTGDSLSSMNEMYSALLKAANQFCLETSKITTTKRNPKVPHVSDVKSFKEVTDNVLLFVRKSLDNKSSEIKRLESDLNQQQRLNARMKNEMDQKMKDVKRTDEQLLEIGQLQTSNEGLQGQLQMQETEMKKRENQFREQLSRREKIVTELQNKLHGIENGKPSMRSVDVQTEWVNDERSTNEQLLEIEKLKKSNVKLQEILQIKETDMMKRENQLREQFSSSEKKVTELQKKLQGIENDERQAVIANMRSVDAQTESEDTKILLEMKRLQKLNTELEKNVIDQKTDMENTAKEFQNLFNEKENALEAKDRDLNEKAKHLQDLHSRVQNLSRQVENSEHKQKNLTCQLNQAHTNLNERIKEMNNLKAGMKTLKSEKDELQMRQRDLSCKLHNANTNLDERLKEKKDLEAVIKTLKSEKDELQTRLSSFAGEKLTKGNPSITDLGDPNRPMKIGEKFSELYDNDWTDAMEKVDEIKSFFPDSDSTNREEILIHHLLRILRCCYQGCFRMATEKVKEVVNIIIKVDTCGEQSNKANNIADNLNGIYGLLQRGAITFLKDLVQSKAFCDSMLNDWDYPLKNEEVMKMLTSTTYYQKCVQLCWYMVIQNPAMCLDKDIQPGTPMDKNMYREFTKSGEKVAFVVWPALFLHENGPLLNKGVVQLL